MSNKTNFTIDLISCDVSNYNTQTKTTEYFYEAGQILLHYEFNIKPKKLYSKLKPILKQQKNNIGLLYIQITQNNTIAKLYPVNNIIESNSNLQLPIKQNITFKNELNLPIKQYLQKCFE